METWIKEYWLKTLFGAIVTIFGFWGKRKINIIEKKFKEEETLRDGVQALLRNEIIKIYNDYIDREYCPIYARENIQNMYDKYHALGGNGTVTDLVKKLFELPTEKQAIK